VSLRRHPVSTALAALVLAFLWLPLLAVVVNSFNRDNLMASWGGATGHWYRLAANDNDVREGLKTTLVIAFASALVSLAVAVSGALWWRRAPRRARALYDGLVYARIIVPEVVFATALFFLFVHFHFRLGLPAMIIGHSVWNSAYATLIIQARLVSLDPSVEEAAADLGATPWRVFRRVTLHALMPAIIAAGLLAFTFSFDDVVTSFFLQGNSQSPLPIVLFGLIRFRLTPEVNAIGVLVMLFTVALMSLAVTAFATANRIGRSERSAGFLDMYRGRG
jgi:ABC-type spermidine/putrescine transport system permease subunit II